MTADQTTTQPQQAGNGIDDLINAPWYQSTSGPGISMTLSSIALTIVPLVNLELANQGVNILPTQANGWISLAVFAVFAARAAYGYVKAKKVLGQKLGMLARANADLKAGHGAASSVGRGGY